MGCRSDCHGGLTFYAFLKKLFNAEREFFSLDRKQHRRELYREKFARFTARLPLVAVPFIGKRSRPR
jgi:hypothetical protein